MSQEILDKLAEFKLDNTVVEPERPDHKLSAWDKLAPFKLTDEQIKERHAPKDVDEDPHAGETISQGEQDGIMRRAWNRLVTSDKESKERAARSLDALVLGEKLGIPYHVAYDHHRDLMKEIGLADMPTLAEMGKKAAHAGMTGAVMFGLATNPLATAVGVGGFMALVEAENLFVHGLEKGAQAVGMRRTPVEPFEWGGGKGLRSLFALDPNSDMGNLLDLVDLYIQTRAASGIHVGGRKIRNHIYDSFVEKFFRDSTVEYNLPKQVYLEAAEVQSWLKGGEDVEIKGFTKEDLDALDLNVFELAEAAENGMHITIPAEKIYRWADKPWWADVKKKLSKAPLISKKFQPSEGEIRILKEDVKLRSGKKAEQVIDEAVERGLTDEGTAKLAKMLIKKDPTFDHNTALHFADEVRLATEEMVKAEGLPEGEYRVLGETTTKIEDGIVETAIKLYEGHDAETVVHEWYHRFYDRMSPEQKAAFDEYALSKGDNIKPQELFAEEGSTFFFSEGKHKEAGGIRSLFENARKMLKILIDKIRRVRGQQIPEKIQSMYHQAADDPASVIPDDSPYKTDSYQLVKKEVIVDRNKHKKEGRVFELSIDPALQSGIKDIPTELEITSVEQAYEINASEQRVKDWEQIYKNAAEMDHLKDKKSETGYAKVANIRKPKATSGKLVGVEVIMLTKGCQRYRATVERVANGILPNETRLEACYGGDCWVNRQFNADFGDFINMEVRDLLIASEKQIDDFLTPAMVKNLNKAEFIREGYAGDSSHLIATGRAKYWLQKMRELGVKKKTIFISAGYAPVTKAQYAELAEFADLFEIHFSISGWFHKNEIALRMADFLAAREAGLNASLRVVTNTDNINGVDMSANEGFMYGLMKEAGVKQEEVLETPFHQDEIKRKGKKKKLQYRSKPTGLFKYVCCEREYCRACEYKCMTNKGKGSTQVSWQLRSLNDGEITFEEAELQEPHVKAWNAREEFSDFDLRHKIEVVDPATWEAEAKRRALLEFYKTTPREIKNLQKIYTKEAMKEVQEDPIFEALDKLMDKGVTREALLEHLSEAEVREIESKWPELVREDGEEILDFAANDAGYFSTEIMLDTLTKQPSMKDAIRELANEKIQDHMTKKGEGDAELYAMILDEQLRLLQGKPRKGNIKARLRKATKQVRDERMVTETAALNAGLQKAARAARKAYAEGDKAGAERALKKARKMAILKAARQKATARRNLIVRNLVKLSKAKLPQFQKDAMQDLLAPYDLMPLGKKKLGKLMAMQDYVAEMEAQGEPVDFDTSELARISKKHKNDLTLNELEVLFDTAKRIAHQGRLKNKLLYKARKRTLDQAVSKIITKVGETWDIAKIENPDEFVRAREELTGLKKIPKEASEYIALILKAETIVRALDGWEDFGPAYLHLFEPMKKANDDELKLGDTMVSRVRKLFDFVDKKKAWARRVYDVDGRSLTKEQMIMVMLNSGNEGNRAAMKKGYRIEDSHFETIKGMLTEEEMGIVKGVWEVLNDMKKHIWETYKEIHGVYPPEVEGQYFPLIFDKKLSWKAADWDLAKATKDMMDTYTRPKKVADNFTMARTGGKEAPLLSFNVIFNHLAETVHYSTHAKQVRDGARLVRDGRFRTAVEDSMGPEFWRQLDGWLQHIANPKRDPLTKPEKWAETLRRNATTAILGLKFTVAGKQVLSLTQTVNEVGLGPTLKNMWDFYTSPREATDFIFERSEMMRQRAKQWNRELNDHARAMKTDSRIDSNKLSEIYFSFIHTMDAVAARPTWMAGYKEGLAKFKHEAKAIEYADMLVRRTQPVAAPMDLAGIQRGGGYARLLTMFYTFFNVFANRYYEAWAKFGKGKTSFAELFQAHVWLVLVPAMAGELINKRRMLTPGEAIKAPISYVAGGFPIIRDLATPILTGFDYQFSPALGGIKKITQVANRMKQGKFDKKTLYKGIDAAGYIYPFPSRQAVITLQGLEDILRGKTYNPSRLMFPKER